MKDKTATARVRKQREARVSEGWQLVTVWVPTEANAKRVRKLAQDMRDSAERLHGLSKEIRTVTIETEIRIGQAIDEHGSAAYSTPSGAALELLTELANKDDLIGFSQAVVILTRAKPNNASYVIAAVPAKISNFIIKQRSVSPRELIAWTNANSDWPDRLKDAVRRPEKFVRLVEKMVHDIRSFS
jgi:hypothetical protein